MAWWTALIGTVIENNSFMREGKKAKAFKAAWAPAHAKEAQKYDAHDRSRVAETNLAKVQSDRQITLTDEASNHSLRKADAKLAMAANGDSTMAYVGEAALAHQTNRARAEINENYDANLEESVGNYRAAKADFYALNQPFKGYKKKGWFSILSSGMSSKEL